MGQFGGRVPRDSGKTPNKVVWTQQDNQQLDVMFLSAGGIAAIVTYGLKGAKDADLPITKGPQTTGENGKGGSVRSRL